MATATGSFARYHPLRSAASGTRGCAKLDGAVPRAAPRVHPGGPLRTSREGVGRRAASHHDAGPDARGDASTSKPSTRDADTGRMVFLGDDRAAFTAAIYAARAGLEPLVFETMEGGGEEALDGEEASSNATGMNDERGVRDAMRAQATKSGAACHSRDDPVTVVNLSVNPFTIETKRGVVIDARTLVVSEPNATALSLGGDVTNETTTTPGAFVARGSGFAAGVAAERWHGPVTRPGTDAPSKTPNPIGTAFAETAKKVRAAVADARASPFAQAERLADVLPGEPLVEEAHENVFSGREKKTASSSFDPRAVRHRGADAFKRLYAGEGVFGNVALDRGETRDKLGVDGNGVSAREPFDEKTSFALVAFFGAEGCAPCARVRPMLASVVDEYDRDRVRFVEMDVEADADMADALGVAGTPFALFYRVEVGDGDEKKDEKMETTEKTKPVAAERVAAVVGGKTKRAYRDALDAILGGHARMDGPRRRFS